MTSAKLAAPFLLIACCASPALAEPGAFGEPKMLIHGNYCGPGNNAPRPPIDALDAACARHDACTPNGGLPSQTCNLTLQRDATLISHDPGQPDDLRALAGFVAATATLFPSQPGPTRVKAPVSAEAAPGAYAPVPQSWAPPAADAIDDPEGPDAD